MQYILAHRSGKGKKWMGIAGCDLGPGSCLREAEILFHEGGLPNQWYDSQYRVTWGDIENQKNYGSRVKDFKILKPKSAKLPLPISKPTKESVMKFKKESKKGVEKKSEKKLSIEQFVLNAIVNLRKPPYLGIHTVYTGFNGAFKEYFPGLDPVKETTKLEKEGKIASRFVKGGALIYLPEDAPSQSNGALDKILGKKAK